MVVLAGIMIYYGVVPGLQILALPVLLIIMLLFACGVSFMLASVNVRFRDVKFITEYLVRIWFFLTPVVYQFTDIPERFHTIAMLNPMFGIIEGFRWSVYGRPFPLLELTVSAGLAFLTFGLALEGFRRVERTFADVV
ncbi:ABC transporter permease [Acidobacteriota bacterium]